MFRLTLRSLRADALRLALSSLAIVLGVAFIAGTLMITDSMKKSAYTKAGVFDRNTDAAVYLVDAEPDATGFDQVAVDRVRGVDGVRAAEGELTGLGGVLGADGKPVLGYSLVASVPVDPALQSYDVPQGRLPQRSGEAVLDTGTVEEEKFTVGSMVRIGGAGGQASDYTLVGVVDVEGTSRDFGGAFIGLTGPDAMRVTDNKGYGRIMVAGADGVSDEELARRIGSVAGAKTTVKTHQQIIDEGVQDAVQDASQFSMVLLMFAVISVLVAAFVIANTFTIVLAQRTRRIALLRVVGATRGQAFRSVLLESGVIGFVASLVGVLLGAGIAVGLGTLVLPDGRSDGVALSVSTVVVSTLLGMAITVGAAIVPAWRGTRVSPVAALSDAAVQTTRSAGWLRLLIGAIVFAAGVVALLLAGATGSALVVAAGGVLTFAGIVLFGPMLVPALVRVLGWPFRLLLRSTADLAVANAVRNPRRIAATATALVIGIGLVSAFMVGAQSTKEGIERSVDNQIGADYLVTAIGVDLPASLVADLRGRPEVGPLNVPRTVESDGIRVISGHRDLVGRGLDRVVAGDVGRLGSGTVLVYGELARTRGLAVDSSVRIAGRSFRVVAVVEPKGGPMMSGSDLPAGQTIVLSDDEFTAMFPDRPGYVAQLDAADGVSDQRARDAIATVLADYPTVTLMDQAGYKKSLTGTVDMLLMFVTAMLGLAVVIALVGVANTLTLSVVERTRENGVLRAVGLTRGRMRGMLAIEAVLMALVGALLGVGLGTGVSAGAVSFLNELGGDFTVVLPWGQLGLILAVAAVAALAASVLPARRAVRRPVVEALGVE
ncbi:ABC transporter permease [Micromonospora polyrhachis]|uniref:Putative ABC transport system permease protein n=1 Tax=Micromonospora polyrhachis TaxID=1282883 RepID=A0A7W7WSI2_9ACTN|nr:FtsX-like permease family protein [Micromonospora polyrhachis]MBB4962014.1 putative ABC transport system permease protein [Micromonospora polyrhachis]